MPPPTDPVRDNAMTQAFFQGQSYRRIGQVYGISATRVRYLIWRVCHRRNAALYAVLTQDGPVHAQTLRTHQEAFRLEDYWSFAEESLCPVP